MCRLFEHSVSLIGIIASILAKFPNETAPSSQMEFCQVPKSKCAKFPNNAKNICKHKLIEDGAISLKELRDIIDTTHMKSPSFMMVLTGVGDFPYLRDDGIFVVPIGCLKP